MTDTPDNAKMPDVIYASSHTKSVKNGVWSISPVAMNAFGGPRNTKTKYPRTKYIREDIATRKSESAPSDGVWVPDVPVAWMHECDLGSMVHERKESCEEKLQRFGGTVSPLYKAALSPAASGYKSMDSAPMDGTAFYARLETPMRFLPYKPSSAQFKSGIKGRWQEMNDYGGWDNTDYEPKEWRPNTKAGDE